MPDNSTITQMRSELDKRRKELAEVRKQIEERQADIAEIKPVAMKALRDRAVATVTTAFGSLGISPADAKRAALLVVVQRENSDDPTKPIDMAALEEHLAEFGEDYEKTDNVPDATEGI
jgi:hypothetical protein